MDDTLAELDEGEIRMLNKVDELPYSPNGGKVGEINGEKTICKRKGVPSDREARLGAGEK